jgi:hypothetical protein
MANQMLILDPIATIGDEKQQTRRLNDGIGGKVIGFIDNGKPNFHLLVDDLAELLTSKHGVAGVVRHRKRGSVPVMESALAEMSEKCDAVITGSGD